MMKKSLLFRFLGLWVRVESDWPAFWELFSGDYARFMVHGRDSTGADLEFCVKRAKGVVKIRQSGSAFCLSGAAIEPRLVLHVVEERILDSVSGFRFIHAAVLGHKGKVLILAGRSGIGKSTLTWELLKYGFSFFSDDLCPVHENSGLVYPYPRALRRREAGVALFKKPGDAAPKPAKKALPIGWIVCLEPAGSRVPGKRLLHIGLLPGANGVISRICALEGGPTARKMEAEPGLWQVEYPRDGILDAKIRAMLHENKDKVWKAVVVDPVIPDFAKDPVMRILPAHEAAYRLLRDIRVGKDHTIPSALFARMTCLASQAKCRMLEPGRLEAMRRLVLELVQN